MVKNNINNNIITAKTYKNAILNLSFYFYYFSLSKYFYNSVKFMYNVHQQKNNIDRKMTDNKKYSINKV